MPGNMEIDAVQNTSTEVKCLHLDLNFREHTSEEKATQNKWQELGHRRTARNLPESQFSTAVHKWNGIVTVLEDTMCQDFLLLVLK